MKISTFCSLVSEQSGKSIYVWGAQGQLLATEVTPEWIRKKETSTANANKAIEMYNKRKGIPGARAFDCSGLVCWALVECGAEPKGFDKTANGLMGMCASVKKADLKDGDLCFKVSDKKAHHVGVYINGKIVEAKGRAYGVVSSSVDSSWDKFGRLKIEWEKETTVVISRNLKKGMKGDDVKAMQKLLIAKGYDLTPYGGADGIFGSGTDRVLRRFQVDHKLKADGICGRKTAAALGAKFSS